MFDMSINFNKQNYLVKQLCAFVTLTDQMSFYFVLFNLPVKYYLLWKITLFLMPLDVTIIRICVSGKYIGDSYAASQGTYSETTHLGTGSFFYFFNLF